MCSNRRAQALAKASLSPIPNQLLSQSANTLQTWTAPTLIPLINASGVVLHTNLGRAPLSRAALQAAQDVSLGYSNLEFDLAKGKRGSRLLHAEELLQRLTGAEAALVVNNNAAAVMLALSALARRRAGGDFPHAVGGNWRRFPRAGCDETIWGAPVGNRRHQSCAPV